MPAVSGGSCCSTTRDGDRTGSAGRRSTCGPTSTRPTGTSSRCPGSGRYRLAPGRTGFDNLAVAGDWTACGLDAGCLEAATRSGVQAARAVLAGDVGTARRPRASGVTDRRPRGRRDLVGAVRSFGLFSADAVVDRYIEHGRPGDRRPGRDVPASVRDGGVRVAEALAGGGWLRLLEDRVAGRTRCRRRTAPRRRSTCRRRQPGAASEASLWVHNTTASPAPVADVPRPGWSRPAAARRADAVSFEPGAGRVPLAAGDAGSCGCGCACPPARLPGPLPGPGGDLGALPSRWSVRLEVLSP